jgi:hypothetical protein
MISFASLSGLLVRTLTEGLRLMNTWQVSGTRESDTEVRAGFCGIGFLANESFGLVKLYTETLTVKWVPPSIIRLN